MYNLMETHRLLHHYSLTFHNMTFPRIHKPPPTCVSARLCADECVFYLRTKSVEDAHTLQKDMDCTYRLENDWLMDIHPMNCHVIHITSLYHTTSNDTLDVDSAKYLGHNTKRSPNWNHHINTVTKKANNTVLSFLQCNIHQCSRYTKMLHNPAETTDET